MGYVKVEGKRLNPAAPATLWEFVENRVHPDDGPDRGKWVKCSICDWHKVYAAGQHKDIKLRLISNREDALHSGSTRL